MNAIQESAPINAAARTSVDPFPFSSTDAIAREIVAPVRLAPGARVMDASCGSGAAALAMADAIGPFGYVLALDSNERLLAEGRATATRLGVGNVSFYPGNLERLDEVMESFDLVVHAFGPMTSPEMLSRRMVQWLRDNGRLVSIHWTSSALDPGRTALREAMREIHPELVNSFEIQERVSQPEALKKLLKTAGLNEISVGTWSRQVEVAALEHWWDLLLQPAFRALLDVLDDSQHHELRARVITMMADRDWKQTRLEAIWATGSK